MLRNAFPLLIKPASYSCNLQCKHCFYSLKTHGTGSRKQLHMSGKTLHRLIRTYLELPLERHVFIWQGGEPTLMGLQFYAQVVQYQKQYATKAHVIENCLQTNGTLITKDFSKFLARNQFLVGLSIDGPQDIHDVYRTYPKDKGSYQKVMESLGLMQKDGVNINALTLLTANNVHHAADIFHHLTSKHILHHQYIPCVEFQPGGNPAPWTVDPLAWGKALCSLFDLWLGERGRISVRYFDALLYTLISGTPGICHMDSQCGHYAVVEYDGSIFPCDFFVSPQWNLGNIHETSWQEVWQHPLYAAFGQGKTTRSEKCSSCQWLALCAGDCQKHRVGAYNTAHSQHSWLCNGYRVFFEHAVPILRRLAGPTHLPAAAKLPPTSPPKL